MTFNVTFYQNSSDNRKVGKTLANITTQQATNKHAFTPESVLITTPIFDGWQSVNYMYIAELNRYYNIESITCGLGGVLELEGAVDVLQTYAGYIKGIYTFVERQEHKYNDMIIDTELPIRLTRVRSMKNIGSFGEATGNHICLTVSGGGN